MAHPIIQSYTKNILRDATWSGSTPFDSYSLDTFERKNPAERVAFAAGTRTITATCATAEGNIVCIPCHNADSVTLTNAAGLSQALTVPTMPIDGHPLTTVYDLSALSNLTSNTWNFIFTKATGTLYVGGALLIFSDKTQFADWSFRYGGNLEIEAFGADHINQYGTRFLQDFQTIERRARLTKIATPDERAQYEAFFRGCGKLPGLIWPDPDVVDAFWGTVEMYSHEETAPYDHNAGTSIYTLSVNIRELSKGKPV